MNPNDQDHDRHKKVLGEDLSSPVRSNKYSTTVILSSIGILVSIALCFVYPMGIFGVCLLLISLIALATGMIGKSHSHFVPRR